MRESSVRTEPVAGRDAREPYMRLPVRFERNDGQFAGDVRFVGRGGGGAVVLRDGSASVMAKHRDGTTSAVVLPSGCQLRVRGPSGEEPLAAKSHFFVGDDPARWKTNVPNYARVAYRQVRPGVDVVFHGTGAASSTTFASRRACRPRRSRSG